jgi:hypothetical protein
MAHRSRREPACKTEQLNGESKASLRSPFSFVEMYEVIELEPATLYLPIPLPPSPDSGLHRSIERKVGARLDLCFRRDRHRVAHRPNP